MVFRIFLLFLPLVHSRININILASTSANETKIEGVGSISDIISNTERGTFRITDTDLKDAVITLSGEHPTSVYVRSPTPWDDLYKTYNWNEISRILQPNTVRITSITNQNVVVVKNNLKNNSNVTATFTTGVSQKVDCIISNIWTKNGNLSANQNISYTVSFLTQNKKVSQVPYQHLWGEERNESHTILIGSSAVVKVELQPEQNVTVMLTANRVTLNIEIYYTASLEGDVVCNYLRKYKGHHFWAYDVNEVLEAANFPREMASKEIVSIQFYDDPRISVVDRKSNFKLIDIPVDIIF